MTFDMSNNISNIVMTPRTDYASEIFILTIISFLCLVIGLLSLIYATIRMYGWICKPVLLNYRAAINVPERFPWNAQSKQIEIPILIHRDPSSTSRPREFTMQIFFDDKLVSQNFNLKHDVQSTEIAQTISIPTETIDPQKVHSIVVTLYPNDTRLLKDKMVRIFSKTVSWDRNPLNG